MSRSHSEPQHEPDVRSKRLSRLPRYLEDYDVEYRGFQHTYPHPSRLQPEPCDRESEMEGAAGMTPLIRRHETERGRDVTEDRDAQTVIQQLREENRRLKNTIEGMKYSDLSDETDSSRCPLPQPRTHSLCKAAKKQDQIPPVPAPRKNKSPIAQVSKLTFKETENLAVDDKRTELTDEELDSETELSSDLSKMRLQSTPKDRDAQYLSRSKPQPRTGVHTAHGPSYSHDQRHIPPQPPIYHPFISPDFRSRGEADYPLRPHYQSRDFGRRFPSPPTKESIYRGPTPSIPDFSDYAVAEISLLKQAQAMCFPVEFELLTNGKSLPSHSRLVSLAPEIDHSTGLVRVGGRLRRSELLDRDAAHPVVLDSKHPLSQLLIKHYDEKLHHPGPERVFAELRRQYWIIKGREAVRRHQHQCQECRKWRGKPSVPKMADLPPARLRLYSPAFYSTGVDCFGPLIIKVGRRNEKRWGIIFKCMTTRGVYIDLLTKIDTDSFLMALRRFTARRGTPHELYSDQGTNFRGGERELSEAFAAMQPTLQCQLAKQKIEFHFNPPAAPHFGGIWEREIRSLKSALNVALGAQHVTEEVLSTVLTEIEGILNSKPLGYVSSDVADVDPVTPNSLLMGRPDSDLPQVIYPERELLSRRRWRHSQVLADHFWAHFVKRYLPELQTRAKWTADGDKPIETGTVVMIIDHQLPRALWPVGKVSATIPGADGKIRTAEVQVQGRKYVRPVSKLIRLLPLPEDGKNL
ncbi:hypothetical protein QQF64_031354 [Cirrhinus molitorella]|uniref:Integrase catalytic domain-containing protein n=1 Tax=Cirrhinus molitorella TaxID=172907 RepID=A0ABR3MWW3_9TELE